jgi:hypothetical protein
MSLSEESKRKCQHYPAPAPLDARSAHAGEPIRWAGESRGRSERGRSEVVVLVREVMRVTAVHFASCGGW